MKGSILCSFLSISLLVLFLMPLSSSAHGDGVSYEEEIGSYTIDIGYSSRNPEKGESVTFDFTIEESGSAADFGDVWVRIVSGEKTLLAGGIHNADFGGARITYAFPEAGTYEINFRFENGGDALAEGSFPIEVSDNKGGAFSTSDLIGVAFGLIFGFAAALFIHRKRS